MAKIENKLTKDFTTLPNALIQDDTLSDRARFLFVYMATKPNDWEFYQKPLCAGLGWSADTLRKYMSELIDAGWITHDGQRMEKGKFTANQYTLHSFPHREKTVSENFRHGKNPTLTKERLIQKKDSNNSIVGKPDFALVCREVIDYLNAKTGSSYRHTSKATTKHITARLKEGFTLDDFKKVIDTKAEKWGTDPKMADYLRPITLFSTKFESYLNESTKAPTKANSDILLKDAQLDEELQESYNNYIKYVQSNHIDLYRSDCRILTQLEYAKFINCTDQPGAKRINPHIRHKLFKKAHMAMDERPPLRRQYSSVYALYKDMIRKDLNNEPLPV